MKLLDSNVIIYAGEPQHQWLKSLLQNQPCAVSIMSKIEVLGFHKLTAQDQTDLESFFAARVIYSLTAEITDRAIALRQQKKMSLGDAIIAATAIEHGVELVTRNTADFDWIPGLKLWNPFDGHIVP